MKHQGKSRISKNFPRPGNFQLLTWLLGVVVLDAFSTVRISRVCRLRQKGLPSLSLRETGSIRTGDDTVGRVTIYIDDETENGAAPVPATGTPSAIRRRSPTNAPASSSRRCAQMTRLST